MGVRVSEEAVKENLIQEGATDEMLMNEAARQGISPYDLVDKFRREQEMDRAKAITGLLAHASLFELWQEYSLAHEKLTLDLAACTAEPYESQVVVSDQDLDNYGVEAQGHVPRAAAAPL